MTDWVARSLFKPGSYIEPIWWRLKAKDSVPETWRQRHADFDGISWFAHLLRETHGVRIEPLPRMPGAQRPPSLWRILLSILRWIRLLWLSPRCARWWELSEAEERPDPEKPPECAAWLVLDEKETAELAEIAKSQRVSTNALMIWAMTRVALPLLEPGTGPVIWGIPINMRGAVNLKNEDANHIAVVPIALTEKSSPADVHAEFLDSLRSDIHWGAWYGMTAGRWFGWLASTFFFLFIVRQRRLWTGIISNLGSWPPAGVNAPDYAWCCTSIVRANKPIGVAILTWNGKLTIGLQAHPTLSRDPKEARSWLESWKRELFSAGRKDGTPRAGA